MKMMGHRRQQRALSISQTPQQVVKLIKRAVHNAKPTYLQDGSLTTPSSSDIEEALMQLDEELIASPSSLLRGALSCFISKRMKEPVTMELLAIFAKASDMK